MDDVPIISIVAHFVSVRYMQVEQVSQLATFSEGLLDYHQQCTEILKGLVETLQMKWVLYFTRYSITIRADIVFHIFTAFFHNSRRDEAASRPKLEFSPKTLADLNIDAVLPLGGSSDGLANGGRFFASQKNNHPSNTKYNNNNKNIDNNNTTTKPHHHQQTNNNNNLLNSNNNNQYNNLFSSQQNLAKTNIIHTSNITRSRIYGSQQSLSTVSNHSSTNSINNTKTPPFYQLQPHQLQHQQQSNSHNNLMQGYSQTNSNTNSHSNHLIIDNSQSPTDVWLNAWNSPPSSATTTTRNSSSSSTLDMFSAPQINNHSSQITTSSSSNFNYRTNNTINSNTTTNSTTSHQYQHTSTNSNHFSNFNSQNGLFSDPWTGEFYYLFI